MEDVTWEKDFDEDSGEMSGYNINGIPIKHAPVQVEYPFEGGYDIERFIMGLPTDESRVLIARALGFQGEDAAELAGFQSIWAYIRRLKKLQARMQSAKGTAF